MSEDWVLLHRYPYHLVVCLVTEVLTTVLSMVFIVVVAAVAAVVGTRGTESREKIGMREMEERGLETAVAVEELQAEWEGTHIIVVELRIRGQDGQIKSFTF